MHYLPSKISNLLLAESETASKSLPAESIVVICIFGGLIILTIALAIILLMKNKKAAKEAELLNAKNKSGED